jgi:hypothetical protein
MVRVMVPPIGTEVRGVNTRTGFMAAPVTPPEVMDVKVIPVIATDSNPVDNVGSALVDSWKPAETDRRGVPRVSPVRVMVIATAPMSAPAVVRTMVVLADERAGEVAVKDETVLAMETTDPKK